MHGSREAGKGGAKAEARREGRDAARPDEAEATAEKPKDAKPDDAEPGDKAPKDAKPDDAEPAPEKDAKPDDAEPGDKAPKDAKPDDAEPAPEKDATPESTRAEDAKEKDAAQDADPDAGDDDTDDDEAPEGPPPRRKDEKGSGTTRQVDRSKKETRGGLRRIAPTRAQDVISQQVRKSTVDPSKVKLPQFPAPASDRPEALKDEEARREEIAAKELARREELLEELDEDERVKVEHDWAHEDGLAYTPDPADREIEIFEIQPPFAYVQLVRNERSHETFYHAIEPKLSRDEQILLDFIEETLVDVLDLQPEELDKTELEEYIRGKFEQVLYDYSISLGDEEASAQESQERLMYYVIRDFIGEGPLEILMRDPMIEDISCDGPHVPLFVYHRKYEAITTTIRFPGHETLDSFVIRLAQRAGKHVSIAEPILDATMRDGSRLQATLSKEVSSFGSTFTIRKFKEVPFTPIDLVRFGTMSSAMLSFLWLVIEHHMSGIYAGGTASGKTTSINALMMFIPSGNKVVTIEDTRELRVPEPNWIAGITREGFGARDAHGRQAGEIDMFQLLKNALRQRPEYIVVGEVRGAEAYNLFQAMATGHAAYGTMHADSVDAVIHRLESDPINIPRSLLEALDVVAVQIQSRVGGKRVRRTKQLTEVVGLDPNTREILTNEVFHWDPGTDSFEYSGISYALERIAQETGQNTRQVADEMEDRVRLINHMVDLEIREYKQVANIIKMYIKEKDKIMAKVDAGEGWDEPPEPDEASDEPGPEATDADEAADGSDAADATDGPEEEQPDAGKGSDAPEEEKPVASDGGTGGN